MKKMQREYKVIDFPPLTAEEKATLERLDKMPDSEINFSDIPPSTPDNNGGFYYIQALRKDGKGYQARLNNVIRWARMNNCPIARL